MRFDFWLAKIEFATQPLKSNNNQVLNNLTTGSVYANAIVFSNTIRISNEITSNFFLRIINACYQSDSICSFR
jgi:hypothetical protein